jgi:hypothetical protein
LWRAYWRERVSGVRKEETVDSVWSRKPKPPLETGWWAMSQARSGKEPTVSVRKWRRA